jgi:outer membrane protein TolC
MNSKVLTVIFLTLSSPCFAMERDANSNQANVNEAHKIVVKSYDRLEETIDNAIRETGENIKKLTAAREALDAEQLKRNQRTKESNQATIKVAAGIGTCVVVSALFVRYCLQ